VIEEYTVRHIEFVSSRSFEEVVRAFEDLVGDAENGVFAGDVAASADIEQFESRTRGHLGASDFMRFLTVDHGAWLPFIGIEAKARMYVIGNPLIARTMIKHDLRVGLNVPVRLMIYEAEEAVRLAYDAPSSLMSRLHDPEVAAAAEKLDTKVATLAEQATGVTA
jgi:hypothetical protein